MAALQCEETDKCGLCVDRHFPVITNTLFKVKSQSFGGRKLLLHTWKKSFGRNNHVLKRKNKYSVTLIYALMQYRHISTCTYILMYITLYIIRHILNITFSPIPSRSRVPSFGRSELGTS